LRIADFWNLKSSDQKKTIASSDRITKYTLPFIKYQASHIQHQVSGIAQQARFISIIFA